MNNNNNKIKKEHFRRTRKLLATKLYSRTLIKRINTWAVLLVRYSGPFLKWTREEIKQMDQRTRKLMTMHKALHPRDDVDRLYVSKKEGGRGHTSIADSVDISIQRLEDYIQKRRGKLITATRNNTDNSGPNRTKMTRKQKWEEQHFKRLISEFSNEKTWIWPKKGNLKRETELPLIATWNKTIRTNHIQARIDKTKQNCKFRLCGDRDETINHLISECSKLAKKEYKTRNDWFWFDYTNEWYLHNPTSVLKNDAYKFLWDF